MLDKIIRFSIYNKLIIGLMVLGLIVWGGYSASKLPIDAVPDITNNQVQILTVSPSLSANEMERLITFPVELAMANIPGKKELRSFSRFGLSVVTIVFDDGIDIYWARQQVSERLIGVKNQIPAGAGEPELAPITTGLGEIYQYVLKPLPGFEQEFDAMKLRSLQDWVIRRQLLSTPGIAEVSSFGGLLKQYEIAIEPQQLKSYNISIAEIYAALQKNNQNTGGAYIDQKPYSYFIRSEGLARTIDDIEKIVVKNTTSGTPILIRNVAKVQYGSAVRYGAMTLNGKGEVVGGIVMMLKGENSSKVIANVKLKVAEIQKTLPKGVVIEAYLDRTKLVNNAISTVTKNLAEGALIVIFVLVLMLGNVRAGLVVVSVIPLTMLFALGMMSLFGVSGNLMSLGAIDFGLIVDGAAIIVEATLYHLHQRMHQNKGTLTLSAKEMDEEVYESARKIRGSAAFGEIIILIVYLPILALTGVEGKMFGPMAQTVSFAIIGAFILSLTYVPMVSALFMNKTIKPDTGFATRLINKLHTYYLPILEWTLAQKKKIVVSSVVMFVFAIVVFMGMGGEFIPTLDEGDFAVETRVMAGSSLSETVDVSEKAGKLLLTHFPDEVIKVVGKIGSSEVPTDPMPVEACDLMIILKPKDEWKKAHSREELAGKMQEVLLELPGVTFGFQQPIQMRFNELMTGARQDVVIKVYGDDLDKLAKVADKIGAKIHKLEGLQDLYIEKITGLQQIEVKFNRDRIAQYGLNIEDINNTIQAAFAGKSAGMVYEGEERYDLVVRLKQENRSRIEDVQNLFIDTPNGLHIPLNQVAEVQFVLGPNQIQRDNTKRFITVGFNVRNRDVQSIVEEAEKIISQKIKLPLGYSVTYGGSFENLQEAKTRLSVAVPVALLLIFVLLYFSFNSVKLSSLIFSAIPLSAIGGVFALWLRDMPFSISAGVGFIALFGVAVLNGIVLIASFKQLENEGTFDSIKAIVIEGCITRLRPVLMTAMVASLGFLPMALSHSSGAEVQKPLATVVIGGLISSTLLTLVVLPALYMLAFGNRKIVKSEVSNA